MNKGCHWAAACRPTRPVLPAFKTLRPKTDHRRGHGDRNGLMGGRSSVCSRVLEETPPRAAEGRQHMGSGSAPGAGEGVASQGGIMADGLSWLPGEPAVGQAPHCPSEGDHHRPGQRLGCGKVSPMRQARVRKGRTAS